MEKLIFLDFDGVLRRITSRASQFDPDCLEYFESAIRQFPDYKIVITSSWRLDMSLQKMSSFFSPDVAEHVIGMTPEVLHVVPFMRFAEVSAFLEERRLAATRWIAVDDNRLNFPEGSPVLFTDPLTGFDTTCAARLVQMLQEHDQQI